MSNDTTTDPAAGEGSFASCPRCGKVGPSRFDAWQVQWFVFCDCTTSGRVPAESPAPQTGGYARCGDVANGAGPMAPQTAGEISVVDELEDAILGWWCADSYRPDIGQRYRDRADAIKAQLRMAISERKPSGEQAEARRVPGALASLNECIAGLEHRPVDNVYAERVWRYALEHAKKARAALAAGGEGEA